MSFQGDSIFWVEVDKVVPNPFQPRREFNEDRLRELADSIRMYGVLQPLTVTRHEVHNDDGSFRTEYELIAGERRWRASKLAGVAQVPVIIRSGEQTEQEKLELAIIENLQREDLNAVDRALAFKQLADTFKLSHSQVAKKVGRSREYVSNSIRLLALPEKILDGLKRGDISEGHARTLLMLKDRPEEQDVLYREILLKKLSVREVERISRKIATDKVRKHNKDTDAHLIEIEREFTDTLGTRVQILKTDYGGKLTIDYFSEDDLGTLLEAMKKQHARINTEAIATEQTSPASEAVSETVVREMDSSAMTTLTEATPLMPIPSEQNEDQIEEFAKGEEVTGSPEIHNDGFVTEPIVPLQEEKTEEVPAEQEIPEPLTSHQVDPTPDVSVEPESKSVVLETEPKEETFEQPEKEVNQNSDLRARLEAELARLDAEEGKDSERRESPAETAEDASEVGQVKKEESDDDSLYSIRNFSL